MLHRQKGNSARATRPCGRQQIRSAVGPCSRYEGAPGTRPAVRPCTACAGAGSQAAPAAAAAVAPNNTVRLDVLKEAAALPSSLTRPTDSAVLSLVCRQFRPSAGASGVDDWTRKNLRGGSGADPPKPLRCGARNGRRCGSVPCLTPQACPRDATVSAVACMRLRTQRTI